MIAAIANFTLVPTCAATFLIVHSLPEAILVSRLCFTTGAATIVAPCPAKIDLVDVAVGRTSPRAHESTLPWPAHTVGTLRRKQRRIMCRICGRRKRGWGRGRGASIASRGHGLCWDAQSSNLAEALRTVRQRAYRQALARQHVQILQKVF
jgi:hypothetical protein